MPLQAGSRLGPYELLAPLGAGGMGEVYRARDPRLDREVAVKVPPPGVSADSDRLRRFEHEARAAGTLSHPNVLAVFDVGEHDGLPYIVSELLEGEGLRSAMTRGAFTTARAMEYGAQMADGLAAAHERGIVHRDLKPENLFLNRDGRIKILDFGLAKLRRDDARPESKTQTADTAPGTLLGTAAYMSPEQVRGEPSDHRSDIFSLGVVLHEMLTGLHPFRRRSEPETLHAILAEEPSASTRDLRPEARRIVGRCLEKRPEDRFQSARDLALDLRSHAAMGSETRSDAQVLGAILGRHRIGTAVVVAVLAGLTVTAWWLLRPRAAPASHLVTPVQITANPVEAAVLGTAIAPDGKYLAYVDPGGVQLRLLNTTETHTLPLPKDFRAGFLEWYPDGTRLLLKGRAKAGEAPALWTVSLFGGEPRRIFGDALWFAVSPDGSHIACIAGWTSEEGRGLRSLWLMGPDGENPRKLVAATARESFWKLAWSPDSKRIAYGNWQRAAGGSRVSIETRRVDGGDPTTLLSDPEIFQSWTGILPFAWSRDGRLIFGRREPRPNAGWSNLWAVSTDPVRGTAVGQPVRLTQTAGFNFRELSLTADGRRVVSLLMSNQADVYVGDLDDTGRSFTAEKRLTFDERNDYPEGWSPDSRTVLFASTRSGDYDVFRQGIEGGQAEAVVSAPGDQRFAALTADGATLLYWEGNELKHMPLAGGPPRLLATVRGTAATIFARAVRCARGAERRCVLGREDLEKNEYVFSVLDPIAGVGRELCRIKARPPFTIWDLSPDGSRVALVHNDDDRVRIVSLATGEERELHVRGRVAFEYVAWAQDGQGLYLNGEPFDGLGKFTEVGLFHTDLAGNATVLRNRPSEWHVYPVLSPDGRRLAFAAMPFHGNAWMIEGF
jgi:Tol biopolymer transport system component